MARETPLSLRAACSAVAILAGAAVTAAAATGTPIHVTTDHGDGPVYIGSQVIEATVSMGGPGYLYCFYEDADGSVARIYPNRIFASPYVNGGTIVLSSARSRVKLVTDKTGQERIECFATARNVALPAEWGKTDLAPIERVANLDQVLTVFAAADPNYAKDTIEMTVRPSCSDARRRDVSAPAEHPLGVRCPAEMP